MRHQGRVHILEDDLRSLPLKEEIEPTDLGKAFRMPTPSGDRLVEVVDMSIQDNVAILNVYETIVTTYDQFLETNAE